MQARLKDAADVELASGQADLTIFPATDTPTPTPTSIYEGYNGWRGEYFDNPNLAGNPVLVRDDANIDINWRRESPGTGVPADNFSARWQRIMTFTEDRVYRFKLWKNDGARVWFDDRLIIDHWQDYENNREFFVEIPVTAGEHRLRVEYYDKEGDAWIHFRLERKGALPTATPTPTRTPTPQPPLEEFSGWRGEYFNNRHLGGEPALVRDDANIDFDWGADSPGDGVRADEFSVRWERIVSFDGGLYQFTARRNDRVRVFIDDRPIPEMNY